MKNRIITVDDPIKPLGNLMAVTIAGIVTELKLPIEVRTSTYGGEPCINLGYPDDFEQQIPKYKEHFRQALDRRPLDVLLKRRIMRILFATTIEEP